MFVPADFGFTDPHDSPANNFQAVKITTLPSAGTLTDNGAAVSAGDFVSVSDINSGLLAFTPAANATGAPYDAFNFQDQDDDGTSDDGADLDPTPRTMTLNVMPSTWVNHAPVGTSNTVTTLENTSYAFTRADFGFTDPNDSPANVFRAVQITALPTGGTLTDNGLTLSAGDFVNASHLDDGLLVYTPAADTGGTAYDGLSFKVQDDGGTFNSGANTDATARTLTLNVTVVNQAPSGADNTVTTLENTAYTFSAADFGFTDTHDATVNSFASVKITSLPYFGTLTNNGMAVSAGDFVSVSDLNAGHLVFTPDANLSGTPFVGFRFQVKDNGGTTGGGVDTDPDPKLLMFNVTWVNQAPVGTNKTVTTLEDTAHTFTAADFGFTDPHDEATANAFYRVKIVSLPYAGVLKNNGVAVSAGDFVTVSDINDGKLVFTPAANANGTAYASFLFRVQDDGGTANGGSDLDAADRTLTVNVTAVNDAPTGADNWVSTLGGFSATFYAYLFGFGDYADGMYGNSFLAVKITSLPDTGTLKLNGVAVSAGDFISLSDINNYALVFTPPQRERDDELHVPGAGFGGHRERRHRLGPHRPHDDHLYLRHVTPDVGSEPERQRAAKRCPSLALGL